MKNLTKPFLSIAIGCLVGFGLSGCSKEDAAAKKINVAALTETLKSEDTEARINACVELAKAGPRAASAVQALMPLLKDNDPNVRRLAAYALGEIGAASAPALPSLKAMLGDPDRQVVMQVVNSLRSIDPKGASSLQNVNVSSP